MMGRRTTRLVLLVVAVALTAMSTGPVPATAAGTWTSPQGRLSITTFDYVQYKYQPCKMVPFLTGTITPDPAHPGWFASMTLLNPEGNTDDIGPTTSPDTSLNRKYQFCGKVTEAGTYTLTATYYGLSSSGAFLGTPDVVSGTFTVTTLPLTSTTTLKVKPRQPDFREKVSFRARSTFNDGFNAMGMVQLQFRWAGRWEPLTTLNLDEFGAAKVTYRWKLCNQLKFRALTVAERHGPPKSRSEAIPVTIDRRGDCVTADSARKVRRVLGT